MRTKMPDVIDAYIQASNSRDADRFGSLFSEDAIVYEEGLEYRGVVAIRKWLASTVKKYGFTLTPIDLSLEKHETVKMMVEPQKTDSFYFQANNQERPQELNAGGNTPFAPSVTNLRSSAL